jgi:hypothetical protein
VIEDVQLVGNGNSRSLEIANGTDNVCWLHVPGFVIVLADGKDARMSAGRRSKQVVQLLEIIVVTR